MLIEPGAQREWWDGDAQMRVPYRRGLRERRDAHMQVAHRVWRAFQCGHRVRARARGTCTCTCWPRP